MKAYILSTTHGVVQIGDTVFLPCAGAKFKASRKGLTAERCGGRVYDVPDKSWHSARLAFKLDREKRGIK